MKKYIKEEAKFHTLFGFILNYGLNPMLFTRFLCNTLYFIQYGPTIVHMLDSIPFRRVYLHKAKYYSYLILLTLLTTTFVFYYPKFASTFKLWPTLKNVLKYLCVILIELRQFLVCMISHYCLFAIWQLLKQLDYQLDQFITGKLMEVQILI